MNTTIGMIVVLAYFSFTGVSLILCEEKLREVLRAQNMRMPMEVEVKRIGERRLLSVFVFGWAHGFLYCLGFIMVIMGFMLTAVADGFCDLFYGGHPFRYLYRLILEVVCRIIWALTTPIRFVKYKASKLHRRKDVEVEALLAIGTKTNARNAQ